MEVFLYEDRVFAKCLLFKILKFWSGRADLLKFAVDERSESYCNEVPRNRVKRNVKWETVGLTVSACQY